MGASTWGQSRGKTMPSKEELTEAFEKADKEKTGKITLKQFQEVLIATEKYESDKKMYKNKGMVDALLFGMDDEMGVKMFKRLVDNADKDKDGFLTAKEMKVMMLMMQPDEDEKELEEMISFMIRMMSRDGSKKVKTDVVVKYFTNDDDEKDEDPKEKAKVMFRMFDTNLDGYLDKKELVGYMNHLSGDDEEDKEGDKALEMLMKMMIAKFDEDEDGKLNFEEFEKFLEEN